MAGKELEVESALPLTSLGSVKARRVQVASFGPYRVKVIAPVGLAPRVRCATSFTDPPAATEPLAVVVSAGLAFVTTTASAGSAQAVGPAALLFRSPEQQASHCYVPAWMAVKELEV